MTMDESSIESGTTSLAREPTEAEEKIVPSVGVSRSFFTTNFRTALSRLVYEDETDDDYDDCDDSESLSLGTVYDLNKGAAESPFFSTRGRHHGEGLAARCLTRCSHHATLTKRSYIFLGCAVTFLIALVLGQTIGHLSRPSITASSDPSQTVAPDPSDNPQQDSGMALGMEDPDFISNLLMKWNIHNESQTMTAAYGQTNPTPASPQQLAIQYLSKSSFAQTQLHSDHLSLDNWEALQVSRTLVELYVLAVFYYSTQGAEWLQDTHWLQKDSHDPCAWYGVLCDDSKAIQKLDLSGNMLAGELPNEIRYLKSLEILNLSNNGLTGPLPLAIPISLEVLNLSQNYFTSEIPLWEEANFLLLLNLSENELKGPIRATEWESLTILNVDHNFLTGTLPSFSHMLSLRADNNRFTAWPTDTMLRLSEVSVRQNHLKLVNNEDHKSLGERYPSLRILDIAENGLRGNLDFLSDWTRLQEINVAHNQFTGTLPMGLATEVRSLVGHHNQVTGSLEDFLDGLDNLQELNLGYNSFVNTTIPVSLSTLTSLQVLDLSHNALTGSIPDFLSSLQTLHLHVNQLTGALPSSLNQITTLTSVKVEENLITGDISICNLEVLSADCELTCLCCTSCF